MDALDELGRVVAPFLPSSEGGINGGSIIPPGPSGSRNVFPFSDNNNETQELPTTSSHTRRHEKTCEELIGELEKDPIRNEKFLYQTGKNN